MVEAKLRIHLFQASVLFFKGFELLRIRSFRAAVLALPVVVRGVRNAVLTADVFDLASPFNLFQDLNDL